MRVLCVDNEAWPSNVPVQDNNDKCENGETYEVVDVFFEDGCIWYELSHDEGYGYWENCFARTSSINETEMERNYDKIKQLT